jgi:hypothetical protein
MKYYYDTFGAEWAHEYMAGEYLETMISELLSLVNDISYSEARTVLLAGLRGTTFFRNLDISEQNNISSDYFKIIGNKSCQKSCGSL